jgi:hypothetical protein
LFSEFRIQIVESKLKSIRIAVYEIYEATIHNSQVHLFFNTFGPALHKLLQAFRDFFSWPRGKSPPPSAHGRWQNYDLLKHFGGFKQIIVWRGSVSAIWWMF